MKLKRKFNISSDKVVENESKMKSRGEFKQMKNILTKDGKFKNVSNTQKGQQLILDESLKIFHNVSDWINNKSGNNYRVDLKAYFNNDDILLQKIVECFLYLAGSIYLDTDSRSKKSKHKSIKTINEKLMPEMSFENVWRFLEVIISYSQYFDTDSSLQVENGKWRNRIKYTCSLSEELLREINLVASQSFYPLPTLEAPVDWSFENGEIKGGYQTYQFEMVRGNGTDIDYSKFSDNIFDCINYIQSVPWRVNEKVLQYLKKDLKAPLKADFVKTDFPNADDAKWNIDLDSEETVLSESELVEIKKTRAIYIDKSSLYNAEVSDYESAVGKYRYVKLAISVAEQYVGKKIYFPHSFDFRGRIYPLPIGLSPQGSDAIKALLLYHNDERMTKSGFNWCWAYLASLWGDDKLEFSDRIIRGKELINADYKEADEPYQFLSHQLEMQKYIADNNYKPSVRIHLDACNSGSQFTSAITGDLKGCLATNVIPTYNENGDQERQDAYMLVAEKSISLTKEMISRLSTEKFFEYVEKLVLSKAISLVKEMISESVDKDKVDVLGFLLGLLQSNGRKVCKVPVMVSNYGGTAGGRAEILWHMLRELQVDRKWVTKKVATLFAKIIGDSIHGVLNGGKAFEQYIQKMNNIIARDNRPVEWTTSDGFHVVHKKNKELKPKKVTCIIPGARKAVSIKKKIYSKNLSSMKMKSAISPNYIHSLDAELLRRTALQMRYLGVMDTDWIHDSFGCHPNYIDKLLEVTKIEFLKMMQADPLGTLDKQLRKQLPLDKKSQKEAQGIIPPNLGDLDLEQVLDSEWFFS